MFKVQKAYKYQLKTNGDIEGQLTRICGSSRFLWNKSLALNLDRLEKGQPILWYNELAFWLTLWKKSDEYGFLMECPSQVLQQKLMDLETPSGIQKERQRRQHSFSIGGQDR
jgi:transposase